MMKYFAFFFSVLLSLQALTAFAQPPAEYGLYMKAAGNQAVLYRGHMATSYANMRYNGHYYWDSPDFRTGSVMLDGKRYDGVLLNVDACEGQLLVSPAVGAPAVVLGRDAVEWFEIDGQRYMNLYRKGLYQNAAPGYYMVVRDGADPIYLRIEKTLRTGPDNFNGKDGIGYDDPKYRTEILTAFVRNVNYYIVKSDRLRRISGRKAETLLNETK